MVTFFMEWLYLCFIALEHKTKPEWAQLQKKN